MYIDTEHAELRAASPACCWRGGAVGGGKAQVAISAFRRGVVNEKLKCCSGGGYGGGKGIARTEFVKARFPCHRRCCRTMRNWRK